MATRGSDQGARYKAYGRRVDGFMLVLALVFLVIWSVASIATGIPLRVGHVLLIVNGLIWAVFIVDLAIRMVLAKSTTKYLIRHPLDLLAVLIPMLRPLKVLTAFSIGSQLWTSRGVVRTSQAVLVSAAVVVWVGAVMVLDFERGAPDATIISFGDALWWAIVTVTTVGYGDFVPVTVGARIVSVGLIILGIAIIGLVTAWVAAWFIRLTTTKEEEEAESIIENAAEIARLNRSIERLEVKIDLLAERAEGKGP